MTLHRVDRVVRDDLCMGCGFCVASASLGHIRLEFDSTQDQFVPRVTGWHPDQGEDPELVCPGSEIDLRALSLQVHGRRPDDYVLGVHHDVRICHAADPEVRRRAASGGVVPALLRHLFECRAIDVAYCVIPGEGTRAARGQILRSPADLDRIHGSVYHPFDFGYELRDLIQNDERFALVGLPCQLAGLEMMKSRNSGLARRHVISIGLFCGGLNKFGGMAYYLRGHRIPWDEVVRIAYRDGDWPGQIRLRRIGADTDRVIPRIHGNSRWGILRYLAGFQGYWMMKRCRLCPDPLADLADIAVGDPHVPRYRSRRGPGHSIVITRTRRGEQWLRDALSAGRVLLEEMSDAETVRASQGYTLDNRRHASAYVRVARLLGMTAPRMTLDPRVESTVSFRHYKFALFDLAKIRIRRWTWLQPLYPILQAVEYLFITFYPSLFVQRMKRLLLNRGR